jgi:hypothetical protein
LEIAENALRTRPAAPENVRQKYRVYMDLTRVIASVRETRLRAGMERISHCTMNPINKVLMTIAPAYSRPQEIA